MTPSARSLGPVALGIALLLVAVPELAAHDCSGPSDCTGTAGYNAAITSAAALLTLLTLTAWGGGRRPGAEQVPPPAPPPEDTAPPPAPKVKSTAYRPVDGAGVVGEAGAPQLGVPYVVEVTYDTPPADDVLEIVLRTPRGELTLKVYRSPSDPTVYRSSVEDQFTLG